MACRRPLTSFMPDLYTKVLLCQGPDVGRSPLPSVAWRPTGRKGPLSSWGSSPAFVRKTQLQVIVSSFNRSMWSNNSFLTRTGGMLQAASVPFPLPTAASLLTLPFPRGSHPSSSWLLSRCRLISTFLCVSLSNVYLLHFHQAESSADWGCGRPLYK